MNSAARGALVAGIALGAGLFALRARRAPAPRVELRALLRVEERPRWARVEAGAVRALAEGTLRELRADGGARAYLLVPPAPRAGVVLLHGHNTKPEHALGLSAHPDLPPIGLELARAGLAVLAPELPFASDELKAETRDALRLIAGGRTLMGARTADALRWAEHLRGLTGRDPGLLGWSMGGVAALYAAALDERIAAVYASGAFGSLERLLDGPLASPDNYVPGILPFGGMEAVTALVCPRPLFLEATREGTDWRAEDAAAGAERLRRACPARAPEALRLAVYDGPHRLVAREAPAWLAATLSR